MEINDRVSTEETVCFSPNVLARDKKMPVIMMSVTSDWGWDGKE